MRAKKTNTEVRREQIAEAALCLVAQHGMKGLNIAGVAHRVGFAPSAVYRHFNSKDEVLDVVLDAIQARLLDNVQAVCEETTDPLKRLHRLLRRHTRLICENEALPRVVFSEEVYSGHASRQARLCAIINSYLAKVGAIIRDGQRRGQLRSGVSPHTLSVMFLGLIQPAAVLWHVSGGRFDAMKQTEQAWQVFGEIIRSRRVGPPSRDRKRAKRTQALGCVVSERLKLKLNKKTRSTI